MADDVNTESTIVGPPATKQLFPIKEDVPQRAATPTLFPSVASATVEEREGQSANFDWLCNTSFKPENAIAIAQIHQEKITLDGEEDDSLQTQSVTFAEDKSKVAEECKDKLKQSRHSSDEADEKRHHEATVRKSKSHRKRHSDSDKYSDDDRKKRKSKHDKHHRKKDRHHSPDPYSSDDGRGRTKHRSKYKKSSHKHKKHSHHKESRRDVSKPSRESKALPLKPSTIWLDETNLTLEDAFREDRKSDRNNLAFKTLYHLHVARYRRLGKLCLGQQSEQVIDWTDDKEEKKSKKKFGKGRYYGKEAIKSLLNDESTVIELSAPKLESKRGGHARSTDMPYLPLEISVAEVTAVPLRDSDGRLKCVDPLGIHDAATQSYLQGKGKDESKTVNLAKLTEDKEVESKNEYLKKRTAEFSKKTLENPNDIKAWLELVKFQDEVVRRGVFGMDETPEGERKKKTDLAVAEKKIAILEKAVEKNPNSIELKIEHLELCKECWTSAKIHEHWQQMAFQHPNDPLLWQQYLMFSQSSFSSFTFNKIIKLYGKCLSTLSSIVEGTFQSHKPLPYTEQYMLDLFVQQCEVLRQAGYAEKSIAAFQAMIEFNCFCPPQLEETTKASAQVAFFETFWDSEEPKFGEKDAKGWNKWMHKKEKGGWEQVALQEQQDDEEQSDGEDELIKVDDPTWKVWHRLENKREQQHWLPWKPDGKKGETEDDCEDPDRLVLFDDFSSSLFKLETQEMKFHLLLRFLQFLGIPTDPAYSSSCYQTHQHFLVGVEHPSQVLQQSMCPSGTGWRVKCQGVSHGIQSLHERKLLSGKNSGLFSSAEFNEFISRVFGQAVALLSGEARTHLTLTWLQYESGKTVHSGKKSKHQVKAVRKCAKSLLKEAHNRNNLLLWETYAMFEWTTDNIKEARKVFDMALTLYSQFGKDSQSPSMRRAAARLCHRYAELELGFDIVDRRAMGNSKDKVLTRVFLIQAETEPCIVSRFGEGGAYVPADGSKAVNPVSLLKARSAYQQEFQKTIESYEDQVTSMSSVQEPYGSYVVHFIICYAIFQYLTVSLQAASVVFEEGMSIMRNLCKLPQTPEDRFNRFGEHFLLDYEMLLASYVRLNVFHMMHQPTALAPIRNLLQRALSEFPDSPAFMDFFIMLEMRSHITGRVRRYFNHATLETNTPLPWFYAVYAEELRQQTIEECMGDRVNDAHDKDMAWQLPSTGITHRIRSLFERATANRTVRYSVLLWRMYIQFEVLYGNAERGKPIFYKALQHCPWSKAIYMDAVQYFPEDFQQIVDLMMEKEIRVRAPVEEVELLMQAKQQESDVEAVQCDHVEGDSITLNPLT
ncbi:LOW QUALITY PROTEIN: nuclear exosome regulator NRDE2-like [Ptychodera flava]|uniref:LOW QUALITY PROTEIN: nuclear exosome regulator NRDE2-like n=1 Tax=Ptychodera flava TaxID=63121 RepID=UPI00396A3A08